MRCLEICFFKELTYIKLHQTSNLNKKSSCTETICAEETTLKVVWRKCFKYEPL